MGRLVQRSLSRVVVGFERRFEFVGLRGAGFSFAVSEAGELLQGGGVREANFRACVAGAVGGSPVVDLGVVRVESVVRDPAIVRCDCGAEVVAWPNALDAHECVECGRLYNGGGQELQPMREWGECTGEHPADLLTGYDADAW